MKSIHYPSLPVHTERAAKNAFSDGNIYLDMGDDLDTLFAGINFDIMDAYGDRSLSFLLMLTMVTVLQFIERLSDRQVLETVRTRLDWKYALHLPLDFPGINLADLAEFRDRLQHNKTEQDFFQTVLNRVKIFGFWENVNMEVTTFMVMNMIDQINRMTEIVTAMQVALETLASKYPEFLRSASLPYWYGRYSQDGTLYRSLNTEQAFDSVFHMVRSDISHLLKELTESSIPEISLLPEIRALYQFSGCKYCALACEEA